MILDLADSRPPIDPPVTVVKSALTPAPPMYFICCIFFLPVTGETLNVLDSVFLTRATLPLGEARLTEARPFSLIVISIFAKPDIFIRTRSLLSNRAGGTLAPEKSANSSLTTAS